MNSQDKLLRFVLVFLLLYSMASLALTGGQLRRAQAAGAALSHELEALEAENARMAQRLRDGPGEDEIIELAEFFAASFEILEMNNG